MGLKKREAPGKTRNVTGWQRLRRKTVAELRALMEAGEAEKHEVIDVLNERVERRTSDGRIPTWATRKFLEELTGKPVLFDPGETQVTRRIQRTVDLPNAIDLRDRLNR